MQQPDEFDSSSGLLVNSEPEVMAHAGKNQPEFVQAWVNGKVNVRSESLESDALPQIEGTIEEPGFSSVLLPGNQPIRVIGFLFTPRFELDDDEEDHELEVVEIPDRLERATVMLVIGKSTAELDQNLAVFGRSIITVFAITILLALGMLYAFVKHGLKPLSTLANRIQSVDEVSLTEPIEIESAPAELVPVVGRLNELLGRLDSAFQREKNFSSDVAHEMRTPLAGLRSSMQVALSKPRDAESYRETIDECLKISNQLSAIVESLLSLARLENSNEPIECEQFDAAELIEQCWSLVAGQAEERLIKADFQFENPLVVETDLDKVRLVVLNLLDNAIAYADQPSAVTVNASQVNSHLTVRVGNQTDGEISPSDAKHVFDRFWRGDQARTNTQTHCGLGLSVCQSMAKHLDGSLTVEISDDGQFVAKFVVPILVGHPGRSRAKQQLVKQTR